MNYHARLLVLFALLAFLGPPSAASSGTAPSLLHERARSLMKSAAAAEARGELRSALGRYRQARLVLRRLTRVYPAFEAGTVKRELMLCSKKIGPLDEKLNPVPDGYIRVWPGMIKKGARFTKGQMLSNRVKSAGDDTYEVGGYTVRLVRSGARTAAMCSCPDFKYRALDGGYPCKHIWAVVLKERLFKGGTER